MQFTIFNHGTGSTQGATSYMTGAFDHKGQRRAGVEILRGNPEEFWQVCDSLVYKNRYKSKVASWAREDSPTAQEIDQVLDDEEKLAFAGLDPGEYLNLAILHRDWDGRIDVHIVDACVHLGTGKSLNTAAPGWRQAYDCLRDMHNYLHGWARPDDPRRARPVRGGALTRTQSWRDGTDLRQQWTAILGQRVLDGSIQNRSQLLQVLIQDQRVVVTRITDTCITLTFEGNKPIKLNGSLFAEEWDLEQIKMELSGQRNFGEGREAPNFEMAEKRRADFEDACSRRAAYNRERYCSNPRVSTKAKDLEKEDLYAPHPDIGSGCEPSCAQISEPAGPGNGPNTSAKSIDERENGDHETSYASRRHFAARITQQVLVRAAAPAQREAPAAANADRRTELALHAAKESARTCSAADQHISQALNAAKRAADQGRATGRALDQSHNAAKRANQLSATATDSLGRALRSAVDANVSAEFSASKLGEAIEHLGVFNSNITQDVEQHVGRAIERFREELVAILRGSQVNRQEPSELSAPAASGGVRAMAPRTPDQPIRIDQAQLDSVREWLAKTPLAEIQLRIAGWVEKSEQIHHAYESTDRWLRAAFAFQEARCAVEEGQATATQLRCATHPPPAFLVQGVFCGQERFDSMVEKERYRLRVLKVDALHCGIFLQEVRRHCAEQTAGNLHAISRGYSNPEEETIDSDQMMDCGSGYRTDRPRH